MFVHTALRLKASEVPTVSPDASLAEAADLLDTKHLKMAVVLDRQGTVRGVVTDSDLVHSIAVCSGHQHACTRTVRDVMTRDVIACRLEDTLDRTWAAMRARGLRHLPVLDAEGGLVGVLSARDVLLCLNEEAALEQDSLKEYFLNVGYR